MQDTSEKSLAYAYIWANESDPDLYGEWDYEVWLSVCYRMIFMFRCVYLNGIHVPICGLQEWRKVHLKDYLEMTRKFMDEIGQF